MNIEAKDAERGLMLIVSSTSQSNPEKAAEIWEKAALKGEDFSTPEVGRLWELVGSFVRQGQAVDLLALEAKAKTLPTLEAVNVGKLTAEYLMGVPPSRHIAPEYAKIAAEASLRRRGLKVLREVAEGIKNAKMAVSDVLSHGLDAWQALTQRVQSLETSEGLMLRYCDEADAAIRNGRTTCIPTGIKALDSEIGGLQSSVLTLVGAYPGVGKSALLATMLWNLARAEVKTGFFSLEDEKMWVLRRWLSVVTGVPLFNFATFRLSAYEQEQMLDKSQVVYAALSKVVIDDRPGLSPADVVQAAKDMVLNHQCKVIILDHLGEIRLERSERYDLDVADALAGLRDVAKRYAVPVVVASHVRRRQGLTIEDAPALTDFANSSAPERMARVALGLSKVPGGIRCTVLKQTNGPAGAHIGLKMIEHAAMINSHEQLALEAA